MATQIREVYLTQNPLLNSILSKIATRLDTLEGLLPDLDSGLLVLSDDKQLSTTTAGSMANQNSSEVEITGGVITITNTNGNIMTISDGYLTIQDDTETTIHQVGGV